LKIDKVKAVMESHSAKESRTAQADTYVVTNTNNSGSGSLCQAITNANNNNTPTSGWDYITFSAVTNGTPIILSGENSEDANASGDLDILKGRLVIQGSGSVNTIIDGGGIDRVFHVCPGGEQPPAPIHLELIRSVAI
jgi:hypothetical protein